MFQDHVMVHPYFGSMLVSANIEMVKEYELLENKMEFTDTSGHLVHYYLNVYCMQSALRLNTCNMEYAMDKVVNASTSALFWEMTQHRYSKLSSYFFFYSKMFRIKETVLRYNVTIQTKGNENNVDRNKATVTLMFLSHSRTQPILQLRVQQTRATNPKVNMVKYFSPHFKYLSKLTAVVAKCLQK